MSTLKLEGFVTAKTAVFHKDYNGVKIDTQKLCVTENSDDKYPISLEILATNYDVDNLKFDKIRTLDEIEKGDFVDVEYKPNCRFYEGEKGSDMFGSNNLWSITVLRLKESAANVPQNKPASVTKSADPVTEEKLPF